MIAWAYPGSFKSGSHSTVSFSFFLLSRDTNKELSIFDYFLTDFMLFCACRCVLSFSAVINEYESVNGQFDQRKATFRGETCFLDLP